MEWKIGEIRQVNGEWYQCVKSNGTCNGCAGKFQPYSVCNSFEECVGKIFKKLEKIGEPFTVKGKKYQRYITHVHPYYVNELNSIPIDDSSTLIEVKQNKEDMEEKKIQHYDCFFDEKRSKSKLKPFDLKAAKAGKPVCTRDGRKARIICFDAKRKDERNIIAVVPSKDFPGFEDVIAYTNNGNYYEEHENDGDLMMLPEKKEGWVNVYKNQIHNTPESAEEGHKGITDYIKTIRVEWEE